MVDLNGHEAGNGGHSQGKPTAYRDSSTRRDGDVSPRESLASAKSAAFIDLLFASRLRYSIQ
jgi:hypothetical protein